MPERSQHLVAVGDAYLGSLVSEITHASFWAKGNNAIIVTYDNGDTNAGCCDAKPGGGKVATIVITSHGPRHAADSQPANHYSLLSTLQHIFGVGCLEFTCDTAHVRPINALFAGTSSKAIATKVLAEQNWPTPTPGNPAEPMSMTTSTKSSGGWTTQRTQRLGSNDNSLGAVVGSSPTDVWAVGNFLPSAKHSNQDATLSFAEHYNGTKWSVVRTPNAGPNFNSFYGLTAAGGGAWAGKWAVAHLPAVPGGADWSNLYGLASSGASVWAVGTYVDPKTDNNNVLFLHEANGTWTINNAPNPGSGSNIPGGITAIDGQLWMAGTYDTGGSRLPLVEHR